eukprot:TRINITY_DN109104_c0_g1_i1.p1 TRINITY_DN109104_c0_g1~~TRINITY_DN109104_c0_g1_i1.p1  ORF type:complete len:409 (-),score=62.99 TRINITY_DN109104_c0_g1_i1:92-1291(-)
MELAGIVVYAMIFLRFSLLEALVLGNVCTPLGEGLVIPRLMEFRKHAISQRLPKRVLAWAPLEATFSLALFGVLTGISQGSMSGGSLAALTLLRLAVTILSGACIGFATARALSNLTRPKICGRQVFSGSPVESFLLVIGISLAASGLGSLAEKQSDWKDILQPELMVIVTGSAFARFVDAGVLHGVEEYIASIWVFGSIVLFGMLGSKSSVKVFSEFPRVVPFMVIGLLLRFLGICIVVCIKRRSPKKRSAMADICFLFLCTLPRATLQGALGSLPVLEKSFSGAAGGHETLQFINTAARLYIICYAILGSLLLECLGPRFLSLSSEAEVAKEDENSEDSIDSDDSPSSSTEADEHETLEERHSSKSHVSSSEIPVSSESLSTIVPKTTCLIYRSETM